MESEQRVDTHDAFKHIWICWQLGGVLPFKRFKSAFVFYSMFINITATILISVSTIIAVFVEEDLRVALINVPYSVSFVVLLLKQFTIITYKGHLYKIKEILKKLDRRAIHKDEEICLRNVVKNCRQLFGVYALLFYFTTTVTIITPFFSSQRLALPTWFPFDVTVESNYRIAYTYQIYAMLIAATQSLALDIFPPSYICVLCAQIKALGIRISRIGGEGIKRESKDNYKELSNCIKDHKTILELFGEVKILTSRTISLQFMVTALVSGTLAMDMFIFKLNFMEILALFIFLLAAIFQILPVCYCANTLQIFNETLTGAIFNCNWIDEDMKFRKSIIIFMQRTQQDLEILAWNVVPISLKTFLTITKFSISMFTILSQLNK